jgi:hypothetical protein
MNSTVYIFGALLIPVAIWQVYLLLNKPKDDENANAPIEKIKKDEKPSKASGDSLDNKTRNIIILFIILISILSVIFFVHKRTVRMHKNTVTMLTKLNTELDAFQVQEQKKEAVEKELNRVREEVFFNNKQLPIIDNPTQSLKYFFSIADKYAGSMHFDFVLADSGFVEADKNVRFNKYVIAGNAYMNQIFSFIDQLERQPYFYTIESIAVNALTADEKGKVMFSLEVYAYYSNDGVNPEELGMQKLKKRRLAYNPFYPRIHQPITYDDEEFLRLLDIEGAEVVALSGERIFIRDANNGIIRGLNIGDRVRYGYLENIYWDKQEAVFRLTRYGVPERITKKLVHTNE